MKASESSLLTVLQAKAQFTIPIYQRTYSWTRLQCQQLWNDILAVACDESRHTHFIGSIVYLTEQGPVAKVGRLTVIDGQQRLTTVVLLLIALRNRLAELGDTETVGELEIETDYLFNTVKSQERYKLLLTQTDQETLKALLDRQTPPIHHSIRIVENFKYFAEKMAEPQTDLDIVFRGLMKLFVVDVVLKENEDDPQLIFESLNSTGLALTQADLIRNFVLMRMAYEEQEKIYNHYWRQMEDTFGQVEYVRHFDAFMRHYLTLQIGQIPRIDGVYDAFKMFVRTNERSVESIVADLRRHATYFSYIVLGAEQDPALRSAFNDLMTLEVNVAIPFLLELYGDYASEHLSKADFLTILRWTESYIIRRLVCDLPTNALNKIFLAFGRSLSKDQYVESVAARYHLLTGTGRFPNDEEFKRDFEIRDFYNISKRRNYLLNKLTNFGTNEPVIIDALTIEHIMPQNENLSAEWRNDLGNGWKRVQETYLHTIGNLTLTGYNSNLSDKPFTSKRDMPGGFRESPIGLSSDLRDLDTWNEDTILKRARRLAERAVTIWPSPTISGDRLAKYRDQKAKNGEAISIEHHFPKPTPIKDLWLSLQQRILNLDPGVTEEILKSYIAYKADTNFVDISVQKTRLILTLNLPFDHLDDPQEWCRDVSTIGKWGNGDAQFYLKPGDNLEYAMNLIGQALQFRSGDESGFVTA